MTSQRTIISLLILLTFILASAMPLEVGELDQNTETYISSKIRNTSSNEVREPDECTMVIVTGSAAKDGRAILMKNRDLWYHHNALYYHPATEDTYAFQAINSLAMGINEKGLAVGNTYVPALAEESDAGGMNGILNRIILETCENVSEVALKLTDKNSPIGPTVRSENLSVATCIGAIDRFGMGAFFEISNSRVSVEYVVNSYQSRANHPRTIPELASGPNGRDQYVLDELDEIYQEHGLISWQDVAQRVSRYVHDREKGDSLFTIDGEVCNDNTLASMVAVSGDPRYDGSLNAIWTECGTVPMVGLYVPSMVESGALLDIHQDLYDYTVEKQEYALNGRESTYDPVRVREIQEYAFAAENYTFTQYDRLMEQMHDDLNDTELQDTIRDFIDLTVSTAADMYVNETSEEPDYAIDFNIKYKPRTIATITTPSTETTPISQTITTSETDPMQFIIPVIGFIGSLVCMIVIYQLLMRRESK